MGPRTIDASLDEEHGLPESTAPLRPVWALALGFAGLLLLELTVFHSGLYATVTEPRSYYGRYRLLVEHAADPPAAEPRPVLVIGDSRIAEGLSGPIAGTDLGRRVINGAIGGSTPRVWAYLLEDMDPNADLFSLVVVPVLDYGGSGTGEDRARRILDLAYLAPRTPVLDGWSLAKTYPDAAGRYATLRSVLLKGYAYRRDVAALLPDIIDRWRKVSTSRRVGLLARDRYKGRPKDLSQAPVDWATGEILGPVASRLRQHLEREPRPPSPTEDAYRERWLGGIVERYAGTGTQVLFFRVPLGPVPRRLCNRVNEDSTVHRLARREHVHLAPEDRFEFLERPETFFDALHMNTAGRQAFSAALSEVLATALE